VVQLNKSISIDGDDSKEIHYQRNGVKRVVQRKLLKSKTPIHLNFTLKKYIYIYTKEEIL